MLDVKTDVETAEKTKLFRFEIRNFLLVGAEIVVDFFCFRNRFPSKIETSRKGYGRIWFQMTYLSKRGQCGQNLLFVLHLLDFKKALEEQINTSCSVLEESIVQTYEKHSKTIQDKLQELFTVLERISMLFILNTSHA